MHQQIRCLPKLSPPDLEKFLAPIAAKGINILAAGGGNLEFDGEFAFAVEDGSEEATLAVLRDAGYQPRLIPEGDPGLTVCWMKNAPGELHRCIEKVARENLKTGRIIRDLIVGVDKGRIGAQVYSDEVRTPAALGARPRK